MVIQIDTLQNSINTLYYLYKLVRIVSEKFIPIRVKIFLAQ